MLPSTTKQQSETRMVERVKKFTDGILKNALENKNGKGGDERITIVLAGYQEGQVRERFI